GEAEPRPIPGGGFMLGSPWGLRSVPGGSASFSDPRLLWPLSFTHGSGSLPAALPRAVPLPRTWLMLWEGAAMLFGPHQLSSLSIPVPVPIPSAGVFDNCSHTASDKGWALGIRALQLGGKKDARFFFSLRTDRAATATEVTSYHRYHPEAWTHLAWVLPSLPSPVLRPLGPPACGQTACDNVELVSHYNQHWPLRSGKVVRYRVVNLAEDDGERPTVSREQVWRQHWALSEAFRPYNISWQLSLLEVRNSSLRRRAILLGCEPSKVGNERCDPECEHPLTGYDGGDCRRPGRCFSWKRRDGICHMECNNMLDDFDDGDCCDPRATDVARTCFDPDSPQRAYMSVKELKESLQLNSTHFLNVYFASSVREELAGAATWPWDKEALSHLGGVVLNPAYYGMHGHTNTMIHEVGHVLGLYHVFKGVSERESCDDPCRETTPSMETGDLCADTAPTPKSKLCRDPDPTNDTCGQTHFMGTPFNNYMSYTDDDCTNTFTPNQVARMHCYLDLVYQRWGQSKKPVPIPIPPMVTGQTQDSLSIYWLPPISGVIHEREQETLCDNCAEDGTFHQYVHEASSPRVCDSSGYWTPEEAEGPPDVDQPCEPSLQAWSPELHLYHMNMTVPCPQPDGCILELRFLHPVYPDSLTLWTTYLSTGSPKALSDIEVLTEQGESIHLGPLDTFCDVPFTVKLNIPRKVSGVKIYTFDERMEIDTALLTSMPHSTLCSTCKMIQYRVLRDPPFANGSPAAPAQVHRQFVDTEVTPGQVYHYQVQAVSGTTSGEASPPLIHVHGAPYCGDGKVTTMPPGTGEDVCAWSLVCKWVIPGLAGEPSLCYVHDGDGVCEPFEKTSSVLDCGPYTPDGYVDLWAVKAYASHQEEACPASLVTGEPVVKVSEDLSLAAWFPCTPSQDNDPPPLPHCLTELGAVVPYSPLQHLLLLKLVCWDVWGSRRGKLKLLSLPHLAGMYELSCQHNPLVINVTHGQEVPHHRAASVLLNFSSPLVGIAAVALRTSAQPGFSDPTTCLLQHEEGHSHQHYSCVHGACAGSGRCTRPLLAHAATVNCTSDSPRHMACTVTCKKGFILAHSQGSDGALLSLHQEVVLMCSSGWWDRSVTCDAVDCGVPDQSHVYYAKFSCPKGTTYLQRCSFSCIHPAKLQGTNQWLTCLEDGLWSLPEAYCKLECDAPPMVANAKLLVPRCLQGNHDVGSVCRYKCKPGYHVAENTAGKPKKKFLKVQCLESGQWETGRCVPVVCEPPPPVFEGMYNCTQGFELDSQCVLNCEQQGQQVSDLGVRQRSAKHCALENPKPFQADGWCDTINNRAYCQYDGGDCCSSTLSSRKVIPWVSGDLTPATHPRPPAAQSSSTSLLRQLQEYGV
uniref:Pappalysin 2 n=1 Tax=Bubo bubo TaxID=30461 RepID=A0A8C0E906_BUBBB